MKSFVIAVSFAVVLMVSSSVLAQGYVAYMPVGRARGQLLCPGSRGELTAR